MRILLLPSFLVAGFCWAERNDTLAFVSATASTHRALPRSRQKTMHQVGQVSDVEPSSLQEAWEKTLAMPKSVMVRRTFDGFANSGFTKIDCGAECPSVEITGIMAPINFEGKKDVFLSDYVPGSQKTSLNGRYLPTDVYVHGRMAYQHIANKHLWLAYEVIENGGFWVLQHQGTLGMGEVIFFRSAMRTEDAHPDMIDDWRLNVNNVFIPVPLCTVLRRGPSPVYISNVPTLDGSDINRWYSPTDFVSKTGQVIYITDSYGVFLIFTDNCPTWNLCWAVQSRGLDGRAVNRLMSTVPGPDPAEPEGGQGWVMFDGNGASRLVPAVEITALERGQPPKMSLRKLTEARSQGLEAFGVSKNEALNRASQLYLDKILARTWFETGARSPARLDDPLEYAVDISFQEGKDAGRKAAWTMAETGVPAAAMIGGYSGLMGKNPVWDDKIKSKLREVLESEPVEKTRAPPDPNWAQPKAKVSEPFRPFPISMVNPHGNQPEEKDATPNAAQSLEALPQLVTADTAQSPNASPQESTLESTRSREASPQGHPLDARHSRVASPQGETRSAAQAQKTAPQGAAPPSPDPRRNPTA